MICPLWWLLMVLASLGELARRHAPPFAASLNGAGASCLVLLD